ncbi:MAG: helix-turn-helix domain-containing protein [Actinomycetota bacterium]|nr:helix-turn-helix domain-containing protein [Actinomycetota bacterium]
MTDIRRAPDGLDALEKRVLARPGAPERVAEIAKELRLAVALTKLREQAGLSQRDVAALLGISQARVASIEKSRNVTVDVLDRYVQAVGGQLEITARRGGKRLPLLTAASSRVHLAG